MIRVWRFLDCLPWPWPFSEFFLSHDWDEREQIRIDDSSAASSPGAADSPAGLVDGSRASVPTQQGTLTDAGHPSSLDDQFARHYRPATPVSAIVAGLFGAQFAAAMDRSAQRLMDAGLTDEQIELVIEVIEDALTRSAGVVAEFGNPK